LLAQKAYASVYFAEHILLGRVHIIQDRFAFVEGRDDDHSTFFADPESGARAVDYNVCDFCDFNKGLGVAGSAVRHQEFPIARCGEFKYASLMFHSGFDD
jgi:hypothetical protein